MRQRNNHDVHDPLRSKLKVALGTSGALLVGLGIASGLGWSSPPDVTIDTAPRVGATDVATAVDLNDVFVDIAEAVSPAVVRIEAQTRPSADVDRRTPDLRQFLPPGFEPDAFGDPRRNPRLSGGTGFIVSEDGYIMTNDHVVSSADQVRVYLNDGRYFGAEVVGTDPFTDVAVLRIDVNGESLPTLSIGDSDEARVGEWVVAVGNPGFGGPGNRLDFTVTAGIVSARSRGLNLLQNELRNDPRTRDDAAYAIEDFIQTDAVINPGNSGGPLVGLDGRVIGINSAIASSTGFYQGYGFAIPINIATRVMEDLVEYGYVRRPIIGVGIRDVTPEDAEYYELPAVAGALVQSITEGGPADEAGLRLQDVIVAVDGESIDMSNQLQQRVARYRPGDRITVRIYRDGEPLDIRVRLQAQDLRPARVEAPDPQPAESTRLGFEVQDVTAEIADYLGLQDATGVVVTNIEPLSPANRAGLGRGLRIVEIQRQPVETSADVRRILAGVEPGDIVSILAESPATGQLSVHNMRMPED